MPGLENEQKMFKGGETKQLRAINSSWNLLDACKFQWKCTHSQIKFLIEIFEFLPSLHRNRKPFFQEETLNVGGNVGIRRLTAGIWNILGMSGDEVSDVSVVQGSFLRPAQLKSEFK